MSFEVRVRVVRGSPKQWTVGKTRSKQRAHEWSSGLRSALGEAFKSECGADHYMEVRVVRLRKKRKKVKVAR